MDEAQTQTLTHAATLGFLFSGSLTITSVVLFVCVNIGLIVASRNLLQFLFVLVVLNILACALIGCMNQEHQVRGTSSILLSRFYNTLSWGSC